MKAPLSLHQKERIVQLLTESFDTNGSTNFVVKQDKKRKKRIENLIRYSIFMGEKHGKIYLSEDELACAIVIYPEKTPINLRQLIWSFRLISGSIGFFRIPKVLRREKAIKSLHPKTSFCHLWYLGVDPELQGKGLGSNLLQFIVAEHAAQNQSIVLETSNTRNFAFYERNGFQETTTITDTGYILKMF